MKTTAALRDICCGMIRRMGKRFALVVSVAAVLTGGVIGSAAPAWADPVAGQSCSDANLIFASLAGALVCSGHDHQWGPAPELQTMAAQTLGDPCTSPDGTTASAVDVAKGGFYLSMCYQGTWTKYHQ